jgi:phage shock protein C
VTDRLYRSPTDRVIAGVAGGLAVWLNLDPSLVRVAWVLLAILSGGIFVLVYIVMMIIVPLPPPGWVPAPRGSLSGGWQQGSPGAGAVPGWSPGPGQTTPPGSGPTVPPGAPPGAAAFTEAGGTPGATTPGDAQQPGAAPPPSGWGTPPPSSWGSPPSAGWGTRAAGDRRDTGVAGMVFGAVLVILGVWFLVDQYLNIDWQLIWPVIVILLGVALIVGAALRSRPGSGT